MIARWTAALISLVLLALPAAADLGPLDTTYGGGDGVIEVVPGCSGCYVAEPKMVARADGSVVLVTHSAIPSHHGFVTSHYLVVQRYLPSGVPDTSGAGPTTTLPMGCCGTDLGFFAVALEADGGILVAHPVSLSCEITFCTNVIAVSRLRADGTPDPTFGTGGRVTTTISGVVAGVGSSADGKVLVAYTVSDTARVLRLTATGQLDTTYGNAGIASIGPPTTVRSAIFFEDGAVVLQGIREVMRLRPDGQPDPAFTSTDGTGVRRVIRSLDESIVPGSLLLQGTRLLMSIQAPGFTGQVLQRLDSAGNDDTSFGPLGRRQYSFFPVTVMAIDSQQRIVMLTRVNDPNPRVAVRRLTAAGDLDISWTPEGLLPIASAHSVWGLQVLPNSKAMIGYDFDFVNYFARIGANANESDREFVLQQYRDFLSREGDSFGVAHWQNQLVNGAASRAQLIQQFLQSAEFQGRIAPVMRLYLAYFLRFPDYAGLQFWVGFSATNPLTSISDAFASSPEFAARYGSTTDAEFVDLVYRNVLGRAPDAAGASFWEQQLASGARTRGEVMLAFSESEEFRGTSFNEVQVAMTYAGMLRREPDAAGYTFWVGYLDAGNSPLALIEGFINTPEYTGRFAP
jgi:uncharacterized delta-60 repeat protein